MWRRTNRDRAGQAGQTALEFAAVGGFAFAVFAVAVLVVLPRLRLTGPKKRELSATQVACVRAVATQEAQTYLAAVATRQASSPDNAESSPAESSRPSGGFVVTSDGNEGALVASGLALFVIGG